VAPPGTVYLRLSPQTFAQVDRLVNHPDRASVIGEFEHYMMSVLRLNDCIALHRAVQAKAKLVVIVE
jgi:hypothetical protein